MGLDILFETAARQLKHVSRLRPALAIVLGSGFHHVLTELCVDWKISCAKIPGFPKPTVGGHAGELIFGKLSGAPVLVLSGRAHFYEGYSMEQVTFPIRTLAALGIRDLLLTNAAGRGQGSLSHADVLMTAERVKGLAVELLKNFTGLYGKTEKTRRRRAKTTAR